MNNYIQLIENIANATISREGTSGVWSIHESRILADRWVNGLATTIPHLPSSKNGPGQVRRGQQRLTAATGGGKFQQGGNGINARVPRRIISSQASGAMAAVLICPSNHRSHRRWCFGFSGKRREPKPEGNPEKFCSTGSLHLPSKST